MQRLLFTFLFSFLFILFFNYNTAFCSVNNTYIPKEIAKYVGTYNIKYFGTVATLDGRLATSVISTDCERLSNSELGKRFAVKATSNKNIVAHQCLTGTRILGGKITIEANRDRQTLSIKSKLQIVGPYFTDSVGKIGKTDTYQYTKYTDVPYSSITEYGINVLKPVKGVYMRNLVEQYSNPNAVFTISAMTDNSIFINMALIDKKIKLLGKIDALTNVEAVKISNNVEYLDDSSLFISADKLSNNKEIAVFKEFIIQ